MFEVASLLAHDSLPSPSPLDPRLLTLGRITFIKQSVILASLVLLFYDYLCTFDQEVKRVWLRPCSLGKSLFFLNRYLPLFSLTLVYLGFKIGLSAAGCRRLYTTTAWLSRFEISVAQAILYLRTIALWARNRWILRSLVVLWMSIAVPSILVTKTYTDSLRFYAGHLEPFKGCIVVNTNPIIFVAYVLLLVSETTVVILTMIRAYKHLRHSNSWWVHQLYARGFLFYFYLLGFTLLNMTFIILAPVHLKSMFTPMQVALHSIFCNRVVFVILSQDTQRDDADFDSRPRLTDDIVMTSMLDSYTPGDEPYSTRSLGEETQHRENPN